jgi:hypothetical protein
MAFPTGLEKNSTAWTMASSGPNGLEDVFYWLDCAWHGSVGIVGK